MGISGRLTACGETIHKPRTAEHTELNLSAFIQRFVPFVLHFALFREKNGKKCAGGFPLTNVCHAADSHLGVQHDIAHPARQRGQHRAGCRPGQCHYRLSLNHASIRIHPLQERCSGRGESAENPKHPRASTNRRNAPQAKMVNQRLKDNSEQISEHPCSGRKTV